MKFLKVLGIIENILKTMLIQVIIIIIGGYLGVFFLGEVRLHNKADGIVALLYFPFVYYAVKSIGC